MSLSKLALREVIARVQIHKEFVGDTSEVWVPVLHTQKASFLVSGYPQGQPCPDLLPPSLVFLGPSSPQQLGKESDPPTPLPPPSSK